MIRKGQRTALSKNFKNAFENATTYSFLNWLPKRRSTLSDEEPKTRVDWRLTTYLLQLIAGHGPPVIYAVRHHGASAVPAARRVLTQSRGPAIKAVRRLRGAHELADRQRIGAHRHPLIFAAQRCHQRVACLLDKGRISNEGSLMEGKGTTRILTLVLQPSCPQPGSTIQKMQ
ncbi:hypothetical protein EVAR_77988_1 [Eumeta japonica]|uniref:Uncharacterized protein n=1 Tax=Eumeta variegata TaxID=151549 RepID=A0A4C1T0S6_EUMVA|nr:hypothetical protein EVAR_77988_1 [Eumeta japonica]